MSAGNSDPPEKGRAPAFGRGAQTDKKNQPEIATANGNAQLRKLPPGKYPGFGNLPSKPGVYRCKLFHQSESAKRDPGHADYMGVLQLTGSKASILVWVHSDGSLGLRLEKIQKR